MRIFIAGPTGVLGRRLVPTLVEWGHEVVGLARSEQSARAIEAMGAEAAGADLFDADSLARAAEGAQVVIHAATAIPTDGARGGAAWELNDRIRRDGTRALARAAGLVGAESYLQQSIVWVTRPPGGGPFDEDTPPNPSAVTRSAVDGEEIAREAGAHAGFQVGILRCGNFYAHDAGHTLAMAEMLRKRRLPIVGKGDNLFAPLHADDACSAFALAAEAGAGGVYHVVDDAPLPFADFVRTFARAIGAPLPRRVPTWLARLIAGSGAVEMVTTSMNTTNRRMKERLGWSPAYPTFAEGIGEVALRWNALTRRP
jgi:nucleoside-diphosphate-sugar epimerase